PATVNDTPGAKGLLLRQGTVVDATLIAAPSSTKNDSGMRDPEMKQSRKGQQWYFGMKAHIGVDSESGLGHAARGRAGSVNDVVEANQLLHGEEKIVFADAGYQGAAKRPARERPARLGCRRRGRPSGRRYASRARTKVPEGGDVVGVVLGISAMATTMIYTHVLKMGG
ncbi:transposase, partial [Rubrivivax gelatinosus]|uniref:transposase n=1 Tax=Rubrivivax gelatinosus TaxID=28068 RepID=UPI001F5BB419